MGGRDHAVCRLNGRDTEGRFSTGNTGRPRGARNRTTIAVLELLEGQAQGLPASGATGLARALLLPLLLQPLPQAQPPAGAGSPVAPARVGRLRLPTSPTPLCALALSWARLGAAMVDAGECVSKALLRALAAWPPLMAVQRGCPPRR